MSRDLRRREPDRTRDGIRANRRVDVPHPEGVQ